MIAVAQRSIKKWLKTVETKEESMDSNGIYNSSTVKE